MKRISIVYFLIFLVLFIINKIFIYQEIKKQNENFIVVNISGKQRMYSQKIAKQVLILASNSMINELSKASLESTLKNFIDAHTFLKKNHLEKYDSYYLKELFTDLEPNYNAIVMNTKKVIENFENEQILDIYKMELSLASNNFLPIMDEIVREYETLGKDRGEKILKSELISNFILVTLLIFFIVYCFKSIK